MCRILIDLALKVFDCLKPLADHFLLLTNWVTKLLIIWLDLLNFFHENVHLVVDMYLKLVSIFRYLLLVHSKINVVCFLYLLPVVYFCYQNMNFLNCFFLFIIEVIFEIHLFSFECFDLTPEKFVNLSLNCAFFVWASLASNGIPNLSGKLIEKWRMINHDSLCYFT